ncbi:MAG: glutathione-disulfide reductase [Alteromonadaceae bacterium]|nr:glutathione-disulfide reductase [Alteromonadaceae bacterium]|tara:strand:- start:95 stop:1459 length:1365 start_codon:yes stop_codon:yes gene_type:complete
MTQSREYDLIVIGAGSGGVRLARMSASYGARVAVVESRYLGGTCVNVGCVPKKLLVYGASIHEALEDAAGYGWTVQSSDRQFSWKTLRQNKDKEINRLNGIYGRLLESAGVTLIEGSAAISGANEVTVGDTVYQTQRIVIATGSWPYIPDIAGKEHIVSSNEMFYLDTLPAKAVVWGGGYIAVEFASILAGLGVDTTLVYRGELFLRGFDEDVRTTVAQELTKKGINLLFNTTVEAVDATDDGGYVVQLSDGETLETGLIMAATGRRPLTEGLGLEAVGVATAENGAIQVDNAFQTNVPTIYALGDVIGTPQLTPVAINQAMVLARNLFDSGSGVMDYEYIPTAVFCHPNIGTVGMTEDEAREAYGELRIYRTQFRPMKHTLSGRDERTMMKLIVDDDSDRVVGAHMVGPDAGEIIQGIAVALKAGATKAIFDSTVGIHPTSAEEFVTMREAVQ